MLLMILIYKENKHNNKLNRYNNHIKINCNSQDNKNLKIYKDNKQNKINNNNNNKIS